MSTEGTGKAREGKYCPRCQTMTFRDREVCGHCGHRFRTGLEEPDMNAPIPDEAALHRTMQFTLPPLPPRGAPLPAGRNPEARVADPSQPHRRWARVLGPAAALLPALLAGLLYYRHLEAAQVAVPSPVGVWETAPNGRSGEIARLRFEFREDGSGVFAWSADSAPPISGQAALRWRVDPDRKLVLTIAPAASPAAFDGPLITAFNSRPWPWQVDRPRHRLLIGTLDFVER